MPSSSPAPTPPEYALNLTPDLSKDSLLKFPAFSRWLSALQHSLSLQNEKSHTFHDAPYRLRSINVQAVDFFGGDRIGFVKLQAEISNDNGEKLPGAVFLRGPSVALLVTLQPDDVLEGSEDEKYAVLAIQARVPAGSLSFAELPAGMVDDSGSFTGAAAKELKEETGLEVTEDQLVDLTKLCLKSLKEGSGEKLGEGFYPSAGGCDEFVPVMLYQTRVARGTLEDWQGKLTGLRDEGEKISLKLVPLAQLWREGARDSKALAAHAMYTGLLKEGKIKTQEV